MVFFPFVSAPSPAARCCLCRRRCRGLFLFCEVFEPLSSSSEALCGRGFQTEVFFDLLLGFDREGVRLTELFAKVQEFVPAVSGG